MSLFDEDELVPMSAPSPSADFWQECLKELSFEVSEADFLRWLSPIQASVDGDVLVLSAINQYFITHIKDNYIDKIELLVKKHAPAGIEGVRLETPKVIDVKPKSEKTVTKKAKTNTQIEESEQLEDNYTFDAFVKGKSNAFAYNACYDLGKKGGDSAYPLVFLYGSSGLGKTHLMHAVAHRYQKAGSRFCYMTKDHFFRITKDAFRDRKVDQLVKKICKADLLIIDDIHLINGKSAPHISDLLLTIFSDFSKNKKNRIILASDRQPAQLNNFDERFKSRFSSGLNVLIEPPDIDMRVQILEKKASVLGMDLPKECALFIAQNVAPDVRRLEGALNQVHANFVMSGEPVTLSLVRHAIKDHIEARARAVNADNIRDLVAQYYGISAKDLMSKKRARNIARPRQMAMALIRELTQDSFPEIGQFFGGRDHTTVMHACKAIEELRATDVKVDKAYQALKATLEFE
ncbi:chromosomal replication initiation protein [Moraxella bovoculi 237]|uniref:Chromosomal replication initiator protein DnaA n=1 Tax=Moraxella bovoculi 237 TaxID=743974 RepID=A0A066UE98_9GAMM|nr:chromosomal replication initiator protein DnaA [Moraxella bovoculi]AKG16330.1 chromosomal replication initiator protein DnaA [Moraxella bovoculi]KDN25435.1 chromosomal replication initiation protein [Moraxella bovoculi 237]